MKPFVRHMIENPIRMFALVCVAVTSAYLGYINNRLVDLLSSPDWCSKAIQAERITPGQTFQGLTGCIDILKIQLNALAKVLLINSGTFALCLGVLVIIVVAGARFAGKLFGNEVDVSRQDPVATAKEVAGAAQDQADVIEKEAGQ